jgi:hypothetical protein
VRQASAGTSELNIASVDQFSVTQAVFVRQSAADDVRKYFGVLVRMRAESFLGYNE